MGAVVIDVDTRSAIEELPPRVQWRQRAQWEKANGGVPDDRGALAPWTGKIVAIGMHLISGARTRVSYLKGADEQPTSDAARKFVPLESEAELLRDFFKTLDPKLTPIVTFNGRGFDLPFIAFRCLATGVRIDRPLWGDRFKLTERIDLMEVLTDFGALWPCPSIDLVCEALGIPSPKADGVGGGDVAAMFAEGRTGAIATYCAGDVEAEAAVFRRCVEVGRIPEWALKAGRAA
jgi:DNA polymerase elongation subunit (family B)